MSFSLDVLTMRARFSPPPPSIYILITVRFSSRAIGQAKDTIIVSICFRIGYRESCAFRDMELLPKMAAMEPSDLARPSSVHMKNLLLCAVRLSHH